MREKITKEQIEEAKRKTKYSFDNPLHEHDDCVRIAYEWLDAQSCIKSRSQGFPLKHLIERWGGRYVSTSDVEVAATLHPRIKGKYPYNISSRLVEPKISRLDQIAEAFTHESKKNNPRDYKKIEITEADQALFKAIKYQCLPAVKEALKTADVNVKNKDGSTPLHLSKSAKITKLLLDTGADIEARNKDGWTAYYYNKAKRRKTEEVAKILKVLKEAKDKIKKP